MAKTYKIKVLIGIDQDGNEIWAENAKKESDITVLSLGAFIRTLVSTASRWSVQ